MFKVGQRVIGTGKQSSVDITGMAGTIIRDDKIISHWAVQFDNKNRLFHDCGGLGTNYYCYNCKSKVLKPLEEYINLEL